MVGESGDWVKMMQKNKNRPGYTKAKVGWIPGSWDCVKLGTLAEVKRGAGSQYLTYVSAPSEGIRLIRINDFLANDPKYVLHTKNIERFILQESDILIAGTGATAGITYLIGAEFDGLAYSYNAPRIRGKRNTNASFLYYQLNASSIVRQQHGLFVGNAQHFLDTDAIRSFSIALPSFPEQEAIAEVLECWDKAIRGYERKIEKKRKIKKGLMQQLLSGKRRLPGFGAELGIENGECGIPDGWKEVPLGETFSFVKSHAFSRACLTTPEEDNTRIYNIHYGDIHATYEGCILDFNRDDRVPVLKRNSDLPSNAAFLQNGDLVMADASEDYEGVGSCVELINLGPRRVTGGLHTFILRDTSGETGVGYRGYMFSECALAKELKRISTGVSVYSLSKTNLAKVGLLLPSLEEQQAIAAVLSSADAEIAAQERKLAALREQKRFLLNNMVTGSLRLPEFRIGNGGEN